MLMRWVMIVVMVLTAACGDHLTTADDDDLAPLVGAVGAVPSLRYWFELVKDLDAVDAMRRSNPDKPVADLYCPEPFGQGEKKILLTVRELYFLLKDFTDMNNHTAPRYDARAANMTFREFVVRNYARQGCRLDFEPYVDYAPEIEFDRSMKPGSDKADRSVAEWLVSRSADWLRAHPEVLVALGLVVVGGVIIASAASPFGAIFCALSDAVECPGSPVYPPGQTPQPGQGDQ